jgi:hypothetical protein
MELNTVLLAGIGTMMAAPCLAGTIGLHGPTWHSNAGQQWETSTVCSSEHCDPSRPGYESTTTTTLRRDRLSSDTYGAYWVGDSGLTLGAYRNSYRRTSIYAAYSLQGDVFGVTAGVASGYGKPRLMVMPTARLRLGGGFSLRVGYVPRVKSDASAVVHFMAEKEL